MPFLIAAGILIVLACVQWLVSTPGVGEVSRSVMTVFSGPRATRDAGWFKTDDRGVFVTQRSFAYVYLGAAAICAWIGVLDLLVR